MKYVDYCPKCGINLWENPGVIWDDPWLFHCDCGERTKLMPAFMRSEPPGPEEAAREHALRLTMPVDRLFNHYAQRSADAFHAWLKAHPPMKPNCFITLVD